MASEPPLGAERRELVNNASYRSWETGERGDEYTYLPTYQGVAGEQGNVIIDSTLEELHNQKTRSQPCLTTKSSSKAT